MNDAVRSTNIDAASEPMAAVGEWLRSLEAALASGDAAAVAAVLEPDCQWRDVLAFTWHITPCQGSKEIAASLIERQKKTGARNFRLAAGRTPPRKVKRL